MTDQEAYALHVQWCIKHGFEPEADDVEYDPDVVVKRHKEEEAA